MNGLKMFAVVGLALFSTAAWGQVDSVWIQTYRSEGRPKPCSILQTPDNGFALAGTAVDSFFLLKVDVNGDSLWWKSYRHLAGNYCQRMISTNDGGFALAGYIRSDRWDDYFLVKVDENGDTLWSRVYGQGEGDSEKCNAFIQTADGGFALLGWYNTYNVNVYRRWLLITDVNGDSLWSKIYDPSIDASSDLVQTEDGGFLLVGNSQAVKTNETGEIEWTHDFGNEFDCHRVIESMDGYAIAGRNRSYETFLTILNANGEVQWFNSYPYLNHNFKCSVTETDDGGFLLASSHGVRFVRTTREGDSLWTARYIGGEMTAWSCITAIPGDGFAIGGAVYNPRNGAFILRTPDRPFNIVISEDSLGVEPFNNLTPSTLFLAPAYPNPFNSTTRIEFGLSKPAPTRLQIFDPLGRRVADLMPPGTTALQEGKHSVVWNATGVPAGEYLIRLQTGEETGTAKVQIVK